MKEIKYMNKCNKVLGVRRKEMNILICIRRFISVNKIDEYKEIYENNKDEYERIYIKWEKE